MLKRRADRRVTCHHVPPGGDHIARNHIGLRRGADPAPVAQTVGRAQPVVQPVPQTVGQRVETGSDDAVA